MKKVLMICNYFAPENQIAAIRFTKLAKYLSRKGYFVEVLTEKKNLEIKDRILLEDAKNISVNYVENSQWMKRINRIYTALTKNYREKKYCNRSARTKFDSEKKANKFIPFQIAYPILGSFDLLISVWRQYDLSINSRKFLSKNRGKYDICFSTYGNYYGHFAGIYLKKINSEILWIADFRDPVYNPLFVSKYVKWLAQWYEGYIYKNCDIITVVMKAMENLIPDIYKKKVRCLYNGYDLEDKGFLPKELATQKKFSFCYTGRMYGGLRNLSAFFETLKELIEDKKVEKNDIELCYAGSGYSIFVEQAEKAGLFPNCKNYGFVPREQSLVLQENSAFLVLSTWACKEDLFVPLTGKLFEYMLFDKPIIAVINGDLETSELVDIMNKSKVGCVYMEFNDRDTREKLKQYINEQYLLFKSKGQVQFNPNQAVINHFNYEHLTDELIHIITEYQT